MVAVTYGAGRVPATKVAGRRQETAPRKSLFVRFYDALMISRERQARREIARHAHLLPQSFDDMPFTGW
jgi:hypothetical protein